MQGLARLGFILLGTWLTVMGAAGFAKVMAEWSVLAPDAIGFSAIWRSAVVTAPALALLVLNRPLARLLFRSRDEESGRPPPSELLPAGLAILGAYFVVDGLSPLGSMRTAVDVQSPARRQHCALQALLRCHEAPNSGLGAE